MDTPRIGWWLLVIVKLAANAVTTHSVDYRLRKFLSVCGSQSLF